MKNREEVSSGASSAPLGFAARLHCPGGGGSGAISAGADFFLRLMSRSKAAITAIAATTPIARYKAVLSTLCGGVGGATAVIFTSIVSVLQSRREHLFYP